MSNQVERAFLIIEDLLKYGDLEVEMMHKHLQIPRSTIFKLLNKLEDIGYVSRSNNNGQTDFWKLTLKFLTISRSIISRLNFKDEIRDILIKLSKEINETVQLGIYSNKKFIYIDVIQKPGSIISCLGVGEEFHMNLCAAGMVLAAALPDAELKDLLQTTKFPKNTPNSISEPEEVRMMLMEVKKNGYAFDDEYYFIGVRCLATPVYNFEGKVIGAINVTGHISTMSNENIGFLKERLLNAAKDASKRLGFKG